MKFKALSTFTVFHDDQMHVCNEGTEGELPDAVIEQYVASGLAVEIKGKPAKAKTEAAAPAPDAAAAAPADADAPPA